MGSFRQWLNDNPDKAKNANYYLQQQEQEQEQTPAAAPAAPQMSRHHAAYEQMLDDDYDAVSKYNERMKRIASMDLLKGQRELDGKEQNVQDLENQRDFLSAQVWGNQNAATQNPTIQNSAIQKHLAQVQEELEAAEKEKAQFSKDLTEARKIDNYRKQYAEQERIAQIDPEQAGKQLEQMKNDLSALLAQKSQIDTFSENAAYAFPSVANHEEELDRQIAELEGQIKQLEEDLPKAADMAYVRKNEQAKDGILSDPRAGVLYEHAQTTQEDMEKVRAVDAYLKNGAGDPAKVLEEYLPYLSEKYGIDHDSGRWEQLYTQLQETAQRDINELKALGVDYEAMQEYRQRQKEDEEYRAYIKLAQEQAKSHPGMSSFMTVGRQIGAAGEFLHSAISGIGHNDPTDMDTYRPAKASDFEQTGYVSAVRDTVANDVLGGGVAGFLYQTGMSMADSLVALGVSAATGLPAAGSALMGMSAAASTAKDVIDRGGSREQAFWGGLAAGATEALMEKVPLDMLLQTKSVAGVKDLLKNVLKQAGTEGAEEMLTELSNMIFDGLIMGDRSNFNLQVQQLMAHGMSRQEAEKKAAGSAVEQVALAGLGGAMSGGVMGGAANVGSYLGNRNGGSQTAQNGAVSVDDLLDDVFYDENTASGETDNLAGKLLDDVISQQEEKQYSFAKIEDITPSQTVLANNAKIVNEMRSVYDVPADKLTDSGKSIKELYADYFSKWGWNIHSETFGDIAVKKSSIGSEFAHGNTAEKIASIEAIPSVIQNGKIVDWFEKTKGLFRITVAAPIKIGKTPYYMGVMLQRDGQNQRLYIHDVIIEKETPVSSQEHLSTKGPYEGNKSLSISSILRKALAVNRRNLENSSETATPNPVEQAFNDVMDQAEGKTGGENDSDKNKVARILTEEPETKTKRRSGWDLFKENFVDRGTVFETLSLKTGNRELQSRWKAIGRAENSAQWFMEHGKGETPSLKSIRETVENSGKTQEFYEYLYHLLNADRMSLEERYDDIANKPVFGNSVTSEMSKTEAAELEKANPEFKQWANSVYSYMAALREMMVDNGVISKKTAKLWDEMYPHYVPIRREGYDGPSIEVALDTKRTGINAPIKKATGGNRNILPLFDTMATRTEQTFKAVARNRFGVELKNVLGSKAWEAAQQNGILPEGTRVRAHDRGNVGVIRSYDEASGKYTVFFENKEGKTATVQLDESIITPIKAKGIDSVDDAIDSVETEQLQEGKDGRNPTFTVFENGEKVTFEITDEMYNTMKPKSELMSYTNKALNRANNIRRGLLTEYNPAFMLTNPIKDVQDVLINSQHPARTYANIPEAIAELWNKNGQYYQEYMEHGGEQNTYFDGENKTFAKGKSGLSKAIGFPLEKISQANNFIERIPRLAEYIASRKMGRSIDVSMLDAARVTTDFSAGGDLVKLANRNGFTFLNASVQGVAQQVRNVREAKAEGVKGWVKLAAKMAAAGLPAVLLNHLLWDDDEEYEELSDYVKQNYYIVAKYGDGKFVRIPKGRTLAVIQDAFNQMGNLITGNDDADFNAFADLVISNLAPNNPLDNNLLAPIDQALKNKTWYGEDLVPTRLQDLPAAEQYDETTDSLSKWLGETLDVSPYKINYVLDQYSGAIGDMFLPMMTPEAERGNEGLFANMIAPVTDKFTVDSVMKNQSISDFYDKKDALSIKANAGDATHEDMVASKYINAVNSDISELYAEKREIQNSDMPNSEKYEAVRDVQKQIIELAQKALDSYSGSTSFSLQEDLESNDYYESLSDAAKERTQEIAVEYALTLAKKEAGLNPELTDWQEELEGKDIDTVIQTLITKAVDSEAKALGKESGGGKYDGLAQMLEQGAVNDDVAIMCMSPTMQDAYTGYAEKEGISAGEFLDAYSEAIRDNDTTEKKLATAQYLANTRYPKPEDEGKRVALMQALNATFGYMVNVDSKIDPAWLRTQGNAGSGAAYQQLTDPQKETYRNMDKPGGLNAADFAEFVSFGNSVTSTRDQSGNVIVSAEQKVIDWLNQHYTDTAQKKALWYTKYKKKSPWG